MGAQEVRECPGRKGLRHLDPLVRRMRVPGEGEIEGIKVEIPVEPGQDVGSLPWIV